MVITDLARRHNGNVRAFAVKHQSVVCVPAGGADLCNNARTTGLIRVSDRDDPCPDNPVECLVKPVSVVATSGMADDCDREQRRHRERARAVFWAEDLDERVRTARFGLVGVA